MDTADFTDNAVETAMNGEEEHWFADENEEVPLKYQLKVWILNVYI